jgi:hypothetical protein
MMPVSVALQSVPAFAGYDAVSDAVDDAVSEAVTGFCRFWLKQ